MKYKFPLLISLGSLALVLTSCTAVSDPFQQPEQQPHIRIHAQLCDELLRSGHFCPDSTINRRI